jgi:hypothetical protein
LVNEKREDMRRFEHVAMYEKVTGTWVFPLKWSESPEVVIITSDNSR